MDTNLLFTGAVQLLVLLFAISAREAAHAWMAERCGDTTGRLLGRVTLNPLRHMDLFGSLFFPILLLMFPFFPLPLVFGWGRPVPVLAKNLRRPGRDDVLVSAAGPAANFLLALLAIAGLVVAVAVLGPDGKKAALAALGVSGASFGTLRSFPLVYTLAAIASVNTFLCLFNLIPLPPFDGGRILLATLPAPLATRFAALPWYGFMVGVAIALLAVLVLWILFIAFLGLFFL